MFSLQMNRERRRYRKLARGVSLAVSKAGSLTGKNLRKESIKSLIKMGKISKNWNYTGRRTKRRSASTGSDASGLSELDRRLEDFSQESPTRHRSFSENRTNAPDEFSAHLQNGSCDFDQWKIPDETSKNRILRSFFSPHRPPRNGSPHHFPFDRSKYVWIKPDYDVPGKQNEYINLSEPVEEISIPILKTKSPFKDDCADKVFETVCDNRSEILLLGWQWLKNTVSILNNIFYSYATVKEIEKYRDKCHDLEEKMLFFVGSSNFQSDYIPWSAAAPKGTPQKEIVIFVLLIHFALINRDGAAYKFLVGGIIGTMVYLFITFKSQYPKGNHINYLVNSSGCGGGDCVGGGGDCRGGGGDCGGGGGVEAIAGVVTTGALVAVAATPLAETP